MGLFEAGDVSAPARRKTVWKRGDAPSTSAAAPPASAPERATSDAAAVSAAGGRGRGDGGYHGACGWA
jgi:hypothetical protein